MIFWQLFYTFCKIGIFNFGGGYAMLALIQNEVVTVHGWITIQEFTDIVAVSQATPGPLGINVATYAGYTAVMNAGFAPWLAIIGAILASFATILFPFLLMIFISHFLLKNKNNPHIINIFYFLRMAIVGVIASIVIQLLTPETLGNWSLQPTQVVVSCIILITVFIATYRYKISPILLLLLSGLAGLSIYGIG